MKERKEITLPNMNENLKVKKLLHLHWGKY